MSLNQLRMSMPSHPPLKFHHGITNSLSTVFKQLIVDLLLVENLCQ